MRLLDADARIFHYEGFLTEEECDFMRKLAEPNLDERRFYFYTDFVRGVNSSGNVIQRIEQRIADWVLMPQENFEGLRITRYPHNRKFHTHWDNAHTNGDTSGGAQYATVLMYLSDVQKGGETIFPLIPAPGGENDVSYSECARKHLAFKPRKGDALLFHGITPNGEVNKRVMHDACPVEEGDKWSMQQFIRVGRFSKGGKPTRQTVNPAPVLPYVDCPDRGSDCKGMNQAKCHSRRDHFIGTVTHPGNCLSRCMRCDIWRDHLKLQASRGDEEAAHPRPQT